MQERDRVLPSGRGRGKENDMRKKTDARTLRELRNEIYVLLKNASNDEAASPKTVHFSNDFMTSRINQVLLFFPSLDYADLCLH